jgi:anaerobic magnesium-protoporphyrin IX monomethyl ester cyclase
VVPVEVTGIVGAIQAAGIYVIGNFIFGLPDDDLPSMQATMDLATELNCEFANFYSSMAYPGAPLYQMAVEKGWELPAARTGRTAVGGLEQKRWRHGEAQPRRIGTQS